MDEVKTKSERTIDAREELRTLYDRPMDLALRKELDHIDRHCRNFIAHSPLLCIGTMSRTGRADVSPRGDPPGFVQVIDEKRLLIPDRPGNNRLDTMTNIIDNPAVGLLFFVPGVEETLRVNGKARIVRDDELLRKAAVNGKTPKVGILVDVEEAFLHCAKALKRSRLWDSSRHVPRQTFPSLAAMILEQSGSPEADVDEADRFVEEDYRKNLY